MFFRFVLLGICLAVIVFIFDNLPKIKQKYKSRKEAKERELKIYKEELKMNLYDSIKNPMEDNKKLKQLIDFYTESDNPKREIYNKLVSATESRDFDKENILKIMKH